MLSPADLRGSFPALITFMRPFAAHRSGFSVDGEATCRHAARMIEAGSAGVVIAATTGQAPVLSHDEHVELVYAIAETVRPMTCADGRRPLVIAYAGSNDTASALGMMDRCAAAAPDAFLQVTGYYNNPPQEGIIKHFGMIARNSARLGIPSILYNVPSRTNSRMSAETIAEIARFDGILGIKEATGDLDHVRRVRELTDRERFVVLSGEDDQVAPIVAMGGQGVISASANRWPREFARLAALGLAGEHTKAAELQEALLPCVRAVFAAKNPIPLHHMFRTAVRPPLCGVEELREPKRSEVLAMIDAAEAIASFPHCD
jgi:4-hydroxy-tetrahydrodipicolinate synthase